MVGIIPTTRNADLMAHMGYSAGAILSCLRRDLVTTLTAAAPDARCGMMRAAIIDAGGLFEEPTGSTWGPFTFEISLHGTTGTGVDFPEAIADWLLNAARMDAA